MIDRGTFSVLGVNICAIDYETATQRILSAAHSQRALGVSALAVHGVMTGALDPAHRYRLNRLDHLLPDGQPVRWALGVIHGAHLLARVYGPELMLRLCRQAASEGLPIYLYGSRIETLECLSSSLTRQFPSLIIAGMQASRFRQISPAEKKTIIDAIRASEAKLVFVGLGCPRQEIWIYEYRQSLDIPLVGVGAAFDFHAGRTPQAPEWMQNAGLEWCFRLLSEPRRLWRRYLLLNPLYAVLISLQAIGLLGQLLAREVSPAHDSMVG